MEDAQVELNTTQETLKSLTTMVGLLDTSSITPRSATSGTSFSRLDNGQSDAIKKVQKIDIRKFRPVEQLKNGRIVDQNGKPPDDFWSHFTGLCKSNRLNDEESILLLSKACDQGRAQSWFSVTFLQPDVEHRPKTLLEAKDVFFKTYLSADWKQDRYFELLLCLWKDGDTVASYFERFSEKVARYEQSVSSRDEKSSTFLKVYSGTICRTQFDDLL